MYGSLCYLESEDAGTKFLWNVGYYLAFDTVARRGRLIST